MGSLVRPRLSTDRISYCTARPARRAHEIGRGCPQPRGARREPPGGRASGRRTAQNVATWRLEEEPTRPPPGHDPGRPAQAGASPEGCGRRQSSPERRSPEPRGVLEPRNPGSHEPLLHTGPLRAPRAQHRPALCPAPIRPGRPRPIPLPRDPPRQGRERLPRHRSGGPRDRRRPVLPPDPSPARLPPAALCRDARALRARRAPSRPLRQPVRPVGRGSAEREPAHRPEAIMPACCPRPSTSTSRPTTGACGTSCS